MVSPFHHLSGEIKRIELLTLPRRGKYSSPVWIQVNLYVNGVPLVDDNRYQINLKELRRSLQGPGEFRIISCGCGDAYCDANGELRVGIFYHREWVEWKHGDHLPAGHYYFERKQFKSVVMQLESELMSLPSNTN